MSEEIAHLRMKLSEAQDHINEYQKVRRAILDRIDSLEQESQEEQTQPDNLKDAFDVMLDSAESHDDRIDELECRLANIENQLSEISQACNLHLRRHSVLN